MEYILPDVAPVLHQVNFRLLDKDGNVLVQHMPYSCFSPIWSYAIHPKTDKVQVFHDANLVPYTKESVERYIGDLNEMGFPIAFSLNTASKIVPISFSISYKPEPVISKSTPITQYVFDFKLADYEWKEHLLSALTLTRMLLEVRLCRIPNIYFKLMDDNPTRDKLDALQEAHKTKTGSIYEEPNFGHMATHSNNGKNVSKDELFRRFKTSGILTISQDYADINLWGKWRG